MYALDRKPASKEGLEMEQIDQASKTEDASVDWLEQTLEPTWTLLKQQSDDSVNQRLNQPSQAASPDLGQAGAMPVA